MNSYLLFIHCYNCSKQIERVIGELSGPTLEKIQEVLIVDNSSIDNTIFTVLGAIKKSPQIILKRFSLVNPFYRFFSLISSKTPSHNFIRVSKHFSPISFALLSFSGSSPHNSSKSCSANGP